MMYHASSTYFPRNLLHLPTCLDGVSRKPNQRHSHPPASSYRNKTIDNWVDICILFGSDRALGDGAEQFDEVAMAMDEEMTSEGMSTSTGSVSKKSKDLCAILNSFLSNSVFFSSLRRFIIISLSTQSPIAFSPKELPNRRQILVSGPITSNLPPSDLHLLVSKESSTLIVN
ncbi:unnamed protein product [Cuscuta campestris]|uniref:Uncharacterized protein n=1 Tax=Cuscuta campestris TaxID=132261 RepID=A0A484MYR9_9ASTE|nr:unnamed protein product [Cuscuta campestris]